MDTNLNSVPETLCLAPWTHTYLSPQTERRMCCASREPAQAFRQYIDTAAGTGQYQPVTLEQHWNSPHMRSVRLRMLAGERLPECAVCNEQLLNTAVYRDYFNHLFGSRRDQLLAATEPDGTLVEGPVSWDYRFTNLCNFKCRTCGDMLSSAWESEQRQHDMINWADARNHWMRPGIRHEITEFQDHAIEQEFRDAVEAHRVHEVYWVGGEPLMYEQHWRYMQRIVELGDGGQLYARYNTNLSRVRYRGCDLYRDILAHVGDWQICASLDGTGATGEYIRTGLNYGEFLANFRRGLDHAQNRRNMRLDFTLTLPGMTEISAMQALSEELGVELLAKVIFSFSPDIVLSPLAMPRSLLEAEIAESTRDLPSGALRDVLVQLRQRPTFEEQWPDQYHSALRQGKQRQQRIDAIRGEVGRLEAILAKRPRILEWYDTIA
jgi:hypothetical protein